MPTRWFWKNWSPIDQRLFWLLTSVGIGSLTLVCYTYFQNPSLAFVWEQFQQIELIEIPLHNFTVGLSSVVLPADNLLLFETFSGSALQPLNWIFYVLLAGVTVGLLIFITFISTLKRYAFLAGIGFSILILVNLHLEALVLFGLTNKLTTGIVVMVYAGTAYFFQSIRTHYSFHTRLSCFIAITFLIGVVVFFFSGVEQPFLHIAANSLLTGMAMSVVFILMVSHEIIAVFVSIVTNSRNPTRSAFHFFIVSAIYFTNLVITYLIREKYIYWDIFTVNSFFLLAISALLGLWGVRNRESLYADAVENPIHVIFLYLGFLLTSFSTICFALGTDSTTLIASFDDIILFSHLGYGIIFIAYVTSNFGPMLLANVQVYKILYKPTTMPFFTFRIASIMATFAFLSYSSPLTTYFGRAYAAHYNAFGDLLFTQGDATTAEAYYRKSIASRNQNHHAHYALATLYSTQLEPTKELKEYDNIIKNTPTEISYLNISDIYSLNGNYAATQEVLTEGLKFFKTSGILSNAQALTYYQIGLLDSSLYYFQKARKNSLTKATAETNLFATSVKLKLQFPADSLLKIINSRDVGVQSNALALANAQQLPLNIPVQLPKDTLLTVKYATLLCNQLTNKANKIDTAQLAPIVTLAKKIGNENFKEYLLVAVAQSYYKHEMTKKALEINRELAYSTGQGKYFNLLGIWFLEQADPLTAANYFKIAEEKEIAGAEFNKALSYTEADSLGRAIPLWKSLLNSKDTIVRLQAATYLKVLELPVAKYQTLTDKEKYGLLHYRVSLTDSALFQKISESISDKDIRAKAIFERSVKWYQQDELSLALDYLALLRGMKLRDKKLADDILIFNLMINAQTKNWEVVKDRLKIGLPEGYTNQKIYFSALLAEVAGKPAEAKTNFTYLATANFLFEEGMLASSLYTAKNDPDKLNAYTVLVNALLARPNSVKLLKAYVKQASSLGFEDEAQQALNKLKKLIPQKSIQ
jgi:Tfp pilus assembly protein PilF